MAHIGEGLSPAVEYDKLMIIKRAGLRTFTKLSDNM